MILGFTGVREIRTNKTWSVRLEKILVLIFISSTLGHMLATGAFQVEKGRTLLKFWSQTLQG